MNQKRDHKATMSPEKIRDRLFGHQQTAGSKQGPEPGAATQPAPGPIPRRRAADRTLATIGASLSIKGDLSGKEDVQVSGRLEGSVVLNENDMTVNESGHVEGSVIARHVLIRGEVNGEIRGLERVTIAATGHVQGTIAAPRVVLEDGGKFKGMIDMPIEKKNVATQSRKQKTPELSSATPQRAAAAEAAARS